VTTEARSPVLTHLGRPAYLLAALLIVVPPADWINNVWPLQPASIAWRYASQGLFSTSVLSIALGMLLASAVAIAGRQLSVMRVLVVVEAILAAVFVLAAVDFALNVVQLRGSSITNSATRATYDLGGIRVTAKYLATAFVLASLATATRRWLRAQRREASRQAAFATPLVSEVALRARR